MEFRFTQAVLLVVLLVSACGGLADEPRIVASVVPRPTFAPTEPPNPAHLETPGGRIYVQNCAACHGFTGRGDGATVLTGQIIDIPDFTNPGTMSVHSVDTILAVVTDGRLERLMPPWGAVLSADERLAVAQFVFALRPPVDQEAAPAASSRNCLGIRKEELDAGC